MSESKTESADGMLVAESCDTLPMSIDTLNTMEQSPECCLRKCCPDITNKANGILNDKSMKRIMFVKEPNKSAYYYDLINRKQIKPSIEFKSIFEWIDVNIILGTPDFKSFYTFPECKLVLEFKDEAKYITSLNNNTWVFNTESGTTIVDCDYKKVFETEHKLWKINHSRMVVFKKVHGFVFVDNRKWTTIFETECDKISDYFTPDIETSIAIEDEKLYSKIITFNIQYPEVSCAKCFKKIRRRQDRAHDNVWCNECYAAQRPEDDALIMHMIETTM